MAVTARVRLRASSGSARGETFVSGHASRDKIVEPAGLDAVEAGRRLDDSLLTRRKD